MIVGAVLAIIFGAANAYLGLIVGMTVSASIPAAVISMAILRVIMKRTSILENNIVQTITSTGESLARSEEHTSELQSRGHLVCRLLLEKKKYSNQHEEY